MMLLQRVLKKLVPLFFIACHVDACAQNENIINVAEVKRIENILAADSMQGRKIGTKGIDKAATFIAEEFKKAGLQPGPFSSSFLQSFSVPDKEGKQLSMANVVGILPGKTRPDEYVIYSAHYDHLGIGSSQNGDSIYNGANDDAAGTTAVILLAKYFSQQANNARTLVFVAFTAEEAGGFGSKNFSRKIDANKVVAMFNIEMIGTYSKWGPNSAYITGFEKSDMSTILQHNLKGSKFQFYPDPYPAQRLFYRSDNATLARLGVPAHTISTAKMEDEAHYHTVDDEVETLDMENMAAIIQAIALSSKTIVDGTQTPTRIDTSGL